MIATKFVDPSPVRDAHISPDNYFPPTIWAFFRATARYLFTPQMRSLLYKLHDLSAANGLHFSQWWYSASSFTLYFEIGQSARILRRGERYFHVSITGLEPQVVPITAKMSVPYYLGVWQPLGTETEVAFRQLNGAAAPGEVFFAVDFDAGHTFHVNTWPEMAGEVAS